MKENETYQCSYFGVGSNVGNFKTTSHQYRLNLQYATTVKSIKNVDIPLYVFSFVPAIDILYKDSDSSYLVGKYCYAKIIYLLKNHNFINYVLFQKDVIRLLFGVGT